VKQFLSVILAAVLVLAVGGSLASGTMAGFFDVEVSTENMMCAGTRTLELSSGPIVVEHAWPSQWYSKEYILLNTGSLDGIAYIHFPAVDDPQGMWQGIRCEEAGTVNGMVYDGTVGYRTPVGVEPIGEGVATTEPELTAEEGGIVGEKADGTAVIVPGLGVDTCNLADFIEVKVYFENVLKVNGMLSAVACTDWELGPIPAYEGEGTVRGGGWGSYFKYQLGGGPIEVSLIGGQMYSTGMVTISDDGTNLYVDYNTSSTGWKLSETHVYAGIDPPPKLAPGQFEKWGGGQNDISSPSETDSYTLPFSQFGATSDTTEIYMAVHAVVCHPQYGCETAWGKGVYRKVRIELHFPDIDEDDLGYHYFDENIPAEAKWDHWPTTAYMGDRCIFDIIFKLWRP